MNTRGLEYGKIVQNVFTSAKTGALMVLIAIGLFLGWNATAVADNFRNLWTIRDGRAVKFQQYLDTLQVARDAGTV
jgi:amino acid transporter